MTSSRYVALLLLIALFCSSAEACSTASKTQVLKIFGESIKRNEALKTSANGANDLEYQRLRKQVENYEESTAIPCLKRSVVLLSQTPNVAIVDALFAHAFSHENSADETESEVLATVFARHGEAFAEAWRKSSDAMKKTIFLRTERGWMLIKSKYPPSKQLQIESRLKHLAFA